MENGRWSCFQRGNKSKPIEGRLYFKMKIRLRTLVIFAVVALLGGCATPSPLEFQPSRFDKSPKQINAELKSLSVRTAPKEMQTAEVNWYFIENVIGDQFLQTSTGTGIPVIRQWESALNNSLNEVLLFRDSADAKLTLTVDILGVDMSGVVTCTTKISALYRVMNRNTGEYVYNKIIHSQGSGETSEAFVGSVRVRLGFVRSVTNSIQLFIDDLKTVGIDAINSTIGSEGRSASGKAVAQRLTELKSLLDSSLISKEEYEIRRRQILDSL
jgi:hypothetical protein